MSQPTDFVLGVNYWPRRKAMYWWSDFEAAEVDQEFAVIASLGMQIVRIFLLWDDWQPTPDGVAPDCLTNLGTVCDLAQKHGLRLDVTFFTGHMSGPNWTPGWLRDADAGYPTQAGIRQLVSGGEIVTGGYRNPFHDPVALVAARLLLTTVVGAYKDHPAIWLWNLGNEPDLFAWPDSAESGRAWVIAMIALIKGIDPVHPVTCGLHIDSLMRDNHLRIHDVFGASDFGVMHAYPMYSSVARGPLDAEFVPFTCALTSALSGKPTLMEEWGGCTTAPGQPSETWEWTAYGLPRTQFMANEDEFATYVEAVLPGLVAVGATGAMLWCYADYIPELWDKPPCSESRHERFFGLVRPDGSLKPHAEVIRRFAASLPKVQTEGVRTVQLSVTPDGYYEDATGHFEAGYAEFLKGTGA